MFTSSANPAQGDDESSVQADLVASHVTAAPVFTVAELVTNHLHELATVGARTSKTIDSYRSFANKWVTPLIGALAVSSVRADDIDAVLDAMARAGRSASSIGHVRTLLRASFAQAHAAGVIASSPMESNESVHRPKLGTYADERPRADESTMGALMEAAQNHPMTELAIRLAMALEVSRTDLVGLQWSDVDMNGRLVNRPDRNPNPSDARRRSSASVVVDPATFQLLEFANSRRAVNGTWVLSSDRGLTPWTPGHISNRWAIVRSRVPGAAPLRLDDLRRRAEGPRIADISRSSGEHPGPNRSSSTPSEPSPVTALIPHTNTCPTCLQRLPDELATGRSSHSALAELRRCLTRGEDAVASLAATGLTNTAIAAQLFVSVKAVEFHLTHVFRKFGILNRTQLSLLFHPAPLAVNRYFDPFVTP